MTVFHLEIDKESCFDKVSDGDTILYPSGILDLTVEYLSRQGGFYVEASTEMRVSSYKGVFVSEDLRVRKRVTTGFTISLDNCNAENPLYFNILKMAESCPDNEYTAWEALYTCLKISPILRDGVKKVFPKWWEHYERNHEIQGTFYPIVTVFKNNCNRDFFTIHLNEKDEPSYYNGGYRESGRGLEKVKSRLENALQIVEGWLEQENS